MPLPVVFAQLPSGDNAAALLDTQFNAVAGLVIIPCLQGGGTVNIIELQPAADAPVVSVYTDLSPVFTWMATTANTGNVTINVAGLGEYPAFKNNGTTLLVAGDIVVGGIYQAAFSSQLNGGAGGFVVFDKSTTGLQSLAPYLTVDTNTGNVYVSPGTVIVAHGPAPSDPGTTVATRDFVNHSLLFAFNNTATSPPPAPPAYLWLNPATSVLSIWSGSAWRVIGTVT